jgi:hypothetical protein
MNALNKAAIGILATAVCLTATAAPVVLEWVQTGSGTASYTTANGVQTVSSDGVADGGRIILADSSVLTQSISYNVTTQFGIPASVTTPIIEISFDSVSTSNGRIRTFTFGNPAAGVPDPAGPINCPYLVGTTSPSGGLLQQDAYCEASVSLVRDVTQANRFYGYVSTGYSTPNFGTAGNQFNVNSGNPIQTGNVFYVVPNGGSFSAVTIPLNGYWQQVLPTAGVPLPSALLLLLTGLGLLAFKRRVGQHS